MRIICLEGPSAVGKTSLAAALSREMGAVVVRELDAAGAPPAAEFTAWSIERHTARWAGAEALAAAAPLVVLDGDPFKGLWYNWFYASAGWPRVETLVPLYRTYVKRGALAFPDLYVVLGATEAQLRGRRAGDLTRGRRNFETHLRLVEPQRRYFVVLQTLAPARVLFADTSDRDALPSAVRDALARLPPGPPDSAELFAHLAAYVTAHDPSGAPSSGG